MNKVKQQKRKEDEITKFLQQSSKELPKLNYQMIKEQLDKQRREEEARKKKESQYEYRDLNT